MDETGNAPDSIEMMPEDMKWQRSYGRKMARENLVEKSIQFNKIEMSRAKLKIVVTPENENENDVVDENGNVIGSIDKSDVTEVGEEIVDENGKVIGIIETSKATMSSPAQAIQTSRPKLSMSNTNIQPPVFFPHRRWDGEKFVPSHAMPKPMIDAKIVVMKDAMTAWKVGNGLLPANTRSQTKQADLIPEKFTSTRAHPWLIRELRPVVSCQNVAGN